MGSHVHVCQCVMHVICDYVYRLQEERLAVIEGMLKQREADHQALNDRCLEHLWLVHWAAVVFTSFILWRVCTPHKVCMYMYMCRCTMYMYM